MGKIGKLERADRYEKKYEEERNEKEACIVMTEELNAKLRNAEGKLVKMDDEKRGHKNRADGYEKKLDEERTKTEGYIERCHDEHARAERYKKELEKVVTKSQEVTAGVVFSNTDLTQDQD